jgi:class 3 adenylate cyclase
MPSNDYSTSRILTLVFTDLADSTALKTQRGDQAVSELITRHRAQVQRLATETGARISGLARPGQVLMSSAVADNARQRLDSQAFTQPIRWQTHGSYMLKGFDEAVEMREAGLEGIASFVAPPASDKARLAQAPRETKREGAENTIRCGRTHASSRC